MKDVFGYELQVGDIVASSSAFSSRLELYIVLRFTPKMVVLQHWNRNGWRGSEIRKYANTLAIGRPL